MAYRQLRKVDALSNDSEHVYECDSCLWIANVLYEKNFAEVELKFESHDCNEKPFRKRVVSK